MRRGDFAAAGTEAGGGAVDVLAAAGVIALGTGAYADIVVFENSAGFTWSNSVLDITRPSDQQPGVDGKPGAFLQRNETDSGWEWYYCEYEPPYDCWGYGESWSEGNGWLEAANGQAGIASWDRSGSTGWIRDVRPGTVVGGAMAWSELSKSAEYYWGVHDYGWEFYPLPEDQPFLIGVRFDPGDGWHYGWIEAVWNGDGAGTLEALAWGYSTEPNTPVLAGGGGLDLCVTGNVLGTDGLPGGFFGQSLAADGERLIAGGFGPLDDIGRAIIYSGSDGAMSAEAMLLPPGGAAGDFFGASVAIDGPWAAVGAPRHDEGGTNAGAVYTYRLADGPWQFGMKILPQAPEPQVKYGQSVAFFRGADSEGRWFSLLLAGSIDGGFIETFTDDWNSWQFATSLQAPVNQDGAWFGAVIATDREGIVVGAPRWDNQAGAEDAGAAHVFRWIGYQKKWNLVASLEAPGAAPGDRFGASAAAGYGLFAVGAPGADGAAPDTGAVYIYERIKYDSIAYRGKFWSEQSKPGDEFGSSVAFAGGALIVGSRYADDGGTDSGAVSIFVQEGGAWVESARFVGKTTTPGDLLGQSAAALGATVATGAIYQEGPGGEKVGAVHLAALNGCHACYPDVNGDGTLDLFDFLGFVNLFNEGDAKADCDGDQGLTLFDFLCFTNAFNAGC